MIFSKDVLFIHVPKTGGMSITSYLLQVLPRPVYYTAPSEHQRTEQGVIWIPGFQHEPLAMAREVLAQHGHNILEFRLVLATLRNPYDMEVSRYAYLNAGNGTDSPNSILALNEDFEGFACKESGHTGKGALKNFFTIDDKIPSNLRILRFENLAQDLGEALREVGIETHIEFPHENASRHADYTLYYTKTAEEAVYRKYKWAFDSGLCQRWEPQNSINQVLRQELRDVKQMVRDCQENQTRQFQDLERWAHELEGTARWAHELETRVQEQEAALHAYRRVLAPFSPAVQLARGLKKRLATRP